MNVHSQLTLKEQPMYLYHMYLREGLRDNILYTLNELKNVHPDLYVLHQEKYSTRPGVSKQCFPHLDCEWGDVVFLCPVHPEKICAAASWYGKRPVKSFAYHAIPVSDLDPTRLAIWLFVTKEFTPDEVILFEFERLDSMQEVPDATKKYYEEERGNRETLFFRHVPHVLHKGSIDMKRYALQHTSEYATGS